LAMPKLQPQLWTLLQLGVPWYDETSIPVVRACAEVRIPSAAADAKSVCQRQDF